MMEGPALANKKKYQSRLTEARKWRMELSTERDNDRSIFEHHLWQKVQQLCEQIQHIEQTSQQTVQTHRQEKRQLQDSLHRSEEENRQLHQQLAQEQSSLTKAQQDLNSANTSLSKTQQQVQQWATWSDALDKEKKALQDSLHRSEEDNRQLRQLLAQGQILLIKSQRDLNSANTSLSETQQQVQQWAARSDTLGKEKKALQQQIQQLQEQVSYGMCY